MDAFTDGIGKNTFQSISGSKLDTSFFCDQQNDQSVVFTFLAYSVFLSQLVGKVETITAFYLPYGYDHGLDAGFLFQSKEGGIHYSYSRFTKNSVRIADIPCPVLQVYHGNLFYFVSFSSQSAEGSCQ